ncbi:MAG TPA: LysM domain-containing protein, partial [Aggregatilineales bacterium]|nr:LysM domain-containing protein [Aggregatilineales bacterium]
VFPSATPDFALTATVIIQGATETQGAIEGTLFSPNELTATAVIQQLTVTAVFLQQQFVFPTATPGFLFTLTPSITPSPTVTPLERAELATQIFATGVVGIPSQTPEAFSPTPAFLQPTATIFPESFQPCVYVVQAGDSISDISRQYNNVSVEELAAQNNLANPNLLFAGQLLIIPGCIEPVSQVSFVTSTPAAFLSPAPTSGYVTAVAFAGETIEARGTVTQVAVETLASGGIPPSGIHQLFDRLNERRRVYDISYISDSLSNPVRASHSSVLNATAGTNNLRRSFWYSLPDALEVLETFTVNDQPVKYVLRPQADFLPIPGLDQTAVQIAGAEVIDVKEVQDTLNVLFLIGKGDIDSVQSVIDRFETCCYQSDDIAALLMPGRDSSDPIGIHDLALAYDVADKLPASPDFPTAFDVTFQFLQNSRGNAQLILVGGDVPITPGEIRRLQNVGITVHAVTFEDEPDLALRSVIESQQGVVVSLDSLNTLFERLQQNRLTYEAAFAPVESIDEAPLEESPTLISLDTGTQQLSVEADSIPVALNVELTYVPVNGTLQLEVGDQDAANLDAVLLPIDAASQTLEADTIIPFVYGLV